LPICTSRCSVLTRTDRSQRLRQRLLEAAALGAAAGLQRLAIGGQAGAGGGLGEIEGFERDVHGIPSPWEMS
jgi:hypothetical protein